MAKALVQGVAATRVAGGALRGNDDRLPEVGGRQRSRP